MPPPGVCMNIINARRKRDGYGTSANPEKFLNQDFEQLKQYCLIRQVRFVDDMFPPDRRSIGDGLLSPADLARVQWLRPMKLVQSPCFTVDGVSRFDFGQGLLGDCWFLASIGALTFQSDILKQVVPDQSFDEDYCGLFHFKFWRFGRWVDVIIDDKLPTVNGRLIFVHSRDPAEFWPALLEKAYAKVCGSYSDMSAGTPAEAMRDFTGGVHICVQLKNAPHNLWDLMYRAGQSVSLMGCGTPQGETSENTVLPNGLVQGHAYTVTGVKQVMSQGVLVHLVRLWNPWGEGEWKGDWSDRSPLWHTVSPQDREMCLAVVEDGEFWMTMEDFCRFYMDLDICCLCPDFLDGTSSCHWKTSVYEGRWVAGTTAGGCMNNPGSFWTNPQYRVRVEELFSECSAKQGENSMMVSLMQKPDKRNRRLVKNLHIGFSVFEVTKEYEAHQGKFPASFFTQTSLVAQTKTYMNAREVMELMDLKPGEYLIVPSTFAPNETASFILTILSKAETHVHENSGGHDHSHEEEVCKVFKHRFQNEADQENNRTFFRQYSDKYEEVDAEQLQKILNEKILKGHSSSGGFSVDACRSMVALMDTSITGKLNTEEFLRLWKKIISLKEIFQRTDVSQSGTLSLNELRNAIMASGMRISDEMLNLMALRYGSSGQLSLQSFISVGLRFDCMTKIFSQLSDGAAMTLRETEWLYLSMYT
ncbi:calpain-1 catalytic subunit-like [Cheilinus undulatus]|uniref:calpain-1 catalytic subunit-like n=1 Tax=Cheilinus undulatus TaxID=241271 RepID=UPI001BD1D63F|nr:calpain-1 catalytic subunit-like [Cheilinus undulatus]